MRLYQQFRPPYERERLRRRRLVVQAKPTLDSYRHYLLALLSYRARQQSFRTKTALGAELVQHAPDSSLPFAVVLFDSWFLHWNLVSTMQATGKDWRGGCPKNRKVLFQTHWVQLQDFIRTIPAQAFQPYQIGEHRYWIFTKVLAMASLNRQRVRIVASYQDEVAVHKTPNF